MIKTEVACVALLEDDEIQAALIMRWLSDEGLECAHFATGAEFRKGIRERKFNLVLLDWMLPDDDGVAVLMWLRQEVSNSLPVMFTTTRSEERSLVRALSQGADDYLIKPLRRAEFLARTHALLRRNIANDPIAILELGGVILDQKQRTASVSGAPVELTEREFDLAVYLLLGEGRLLSREELLQNVWHTNPDLRTRTVDAHISRLRNKLSLIPERGFELSPVYHKGYRLIFRGAIKGPPKDPATAETK